MSNINDNNKKILEEEKIDLKPQLTEGQQIKLLIDNVISEVIEFIF